MKENLKMHVKDLVELAILVAVAIVFDTFIKIPIQIAGGSINFSAVPLIVIALRHGPLKGFIAGGIIFGLITCAIDGYGFACYPLDYLVAFGSVFIIGLFSQKIFNLYDEKSKKRIISFILLTCAIIISGLIRFVSASIDSIILYGCDLKTALIYNLTYIPFSILINVIVSLILFPTIVLLNERYKTYFLSK